MKYSLNLDPNYNMKKYLEDDLSYRLKHQLQGSYIDHILYKQIQIGTGLDIFNTSVNVGSRIAENLKSIWDFRT